MFKKEQFKKFSLVDVSIYTTIVVFLLIGILLFFRGIYPERRDRERIQELVVLEKAVNAYFRDHGEYPEMREWECLEKDQIKNGIFSQTIKDYISEIPQDPLFNPEKPDSKFCYWYKTTQDNREYKIYAFLEKGKEIYQIHSPDGEWIYTGQLDEVFWFDSNWKFRKKIVIDHTKISQDLNNFPLLIYLKDGDLKEHTARKGRDIIFINSEGEKLKREIENYDSLTGELFAWLKIPFLSSIEDTEIYIYYGNPQTVQIDDEDTWEENFLMVQHFNETSGNSLDSTSNSIDGEPQGDLEQGVSGVIYKAYGFDGLDDFVNLGNPTLFSDLEGLTIEVWVQSKEVQGDRGILGWEGNDSDAWQVIVGKYDNLFRVNIPAGIYVLQTKTILQENEWNHLVFVYDGRDLISYSNGEQKLIKETAGGLLKRKGGGFAEIGRYYKEPWIAGGQVLRSYSFNGLIDEIRISDKARDSVWVKTSFKNQNDPSSFIKVNWQELY